MPSPARSLLRAAPAAAGFGEARPRAVMLVLALCAANLLAWLAALALFSDRPALLGSALLAWGFGLRHAVDADHIAAIDNVTRRSMQDGGRPVAIGLCFSIGHSAVVALFCVVVVAAHGWLGVQAGRFVAWGGIGGTLISTLFLFMIGGANLLLLCRLLRGRHVAHSHHAALVRGGLLSRWLSPLLRRVGSARGMIALGFLFGLGFDTATEIGVLALAATGAGGIGWAVMCFPALFAAGMSLVDTLDGILMLGAYGWALDAPAGQRTYNMAITAASVLVAFGIGLLELAGLTPAPFDLSPGLVRALGDHSGLVGASIVAAFTLLWLAAIGLQRLRARPAC